MYVCSPSQDADLALEWRTERTSSAVGISENWGLETSCLKTGELLPTRVVLTPWGSSGTFLALCSRDALVFWPLCGHTQVSDPKDHNLSPFKIPKGLSSPLRGPKSMVNQTRWHWLMGARIQRRWVGGPAGCRNKSSCSPSWCVF